MSSAQAYVVLGMIIGSIGSSLAMTTIDVMLYGGIPIVPHFDKEQLVMLQSVIAEMAAETCVAAVENWAGHD
jgi:hypothetical protein